MTKKLIHIIVFCSIGYFLDFFDLTLIAVYAQKIVSEFPNEGLSIASLVQAQMIGVFIGAIVLGFFADLRGRLTVVRYSILIFSLGAIAVSFCHHAKLLYLSLFVLGFGVAGEVGSAIVFAVENATEKTRGLTSSLIFAFGAAGGLIPLIWANHFEWRQFYLFGGLLGVVVFFIRVGISESAVFAKQDTNRLTWKVQLREFFSLKFLMKILGYLILVLPLPFCFSVFVPHLSKIASITGQGLALKDIFMAMVTGGILGNILGGSFAKNDRQRLHFIFVQHVTFFIALSVIFLKSDLSHQILTGAFFVLGLSIGYMGNVSAMAVLEFPTLQRGKWLSMLVNFNRFSSVPLLAILGLLIPTFALENSILMVGAMCVLISGTVALVRIIRLKKDA